MPSLSGLTLTCPCSVARAQLSATLSADASPVCAFCTNVYGALKRLYSFKIDTYVNENDDPMFPSWRSYAQIIDKRSVCLLLLACVVSIWPCLAPRAPRHLASP